MAEVAALIRKRNLRKAQRAVITRVINQTRDILKEEELDKVKLKHKRVVLIEKRDAVRVLDEEILAAAPDDELEDKIQRADDVREQMELIITEIDEKLDTTITRLPRSLEGTTPTVTVTTYETHTTPSLVETTAPTTPTTSAPPTVATTDPAIASTSDIAGTTGTLTTSTSSTRGSITTVGVKLPEITLKRFGGDLGRWKTFWDTFESTIHSSSTLSSVQKFTYLRSLLESPAADAISGLTLTSANYEEAISILQKRYGNNQLIISKHMDTLVGLEPITAQGSTRQLRRFYDTVETQVRGLQALGVSLESYGMLLSNTLLKKLPNDVQLIVSRGMTDENWDLEAILSLLEKELTARERTAGIQNTRKQVGMGKPLPHTGAALVNPSISNCVYCGQNYHSSNECHTVPSVEARKQLLKQTGRCYICLRQNHISRNCRSSGRCSQCHGRHHRSICDRAIADVSHTSKPIVPPSTPSTPVMYVNSRTQVLLQTASLVIHSAHKPIPSLKVRAVLDCGSQRTYITSKVQRALSLSTQHVEMVDIRAFGAAVGRQELCNVVQFCIITRNGNTEKISALVVPHICDAIYDRSPEEIAKRYSHLNGLDLADDDQRGRATATVDLLIGSDYYWKLVSGQVKRGDEGPIALSTKVGWILSGPVEERETEEAILGNSKIQTLRVDTTTTSLDSELNRFWELESIGISPTEESVQVKFTQQITFQKGRYEVTCSLPWRAGGRKLPDNYDLCTRRLWGLHRRLIKDPTLLKAYHGVIEEQLNQGIVQPITESSSVVERIHYLPHHPVVRQDKLTTKVRVVYDASAAEKGKPSLNQCLHVGPNFGQSILDILIRFRTYKVALIGDIEKAFLMISVADRDKDVLRFLWFENPFLQNPKVVEYKFNRVVFGVASSPFLLNATIHHHISQYREQDPEFVDKFLRGIYVDDLTTGSSDISDCYDLYIKAKTRLLEAGFNLRKFVTNSVELLNMINHNEGLDQEDLPSEHKVLGICWKPKDDCLQFDVKTLANSVKSLIPTKRNVVGLASQIYDPLGLLSPVTISFKIFFQSLCKAQLQWDEPLTPELNNQWKSLTSSICRVKPIVVPRHPEGMSQSGNVTVQLVGFCDASQRAYAAVVYLRVSGEITSVSILASKTRVAPLKNVTIPRLELLSALLLSRLIHTIECALKADAIQRLSPICFTDSKIALGWICHADREWKQFIENRVTEIRRLVPPEYWYHCAGIDNPADMPSRGLTSGELEGSLSSWLGGAQMASRTDTTR